MFNILKRKHVNGDEYNTEIKRTVRCSKRESDLSDMYVTLTADVQDSNSTIINLPDCMLDEIQQEITRLGKAKIQLGVDVEFSKDGEIKEAYISNKAMKFLNTTLEDGILKLQEKIENYTNMSSGWIVLRIMKIFITFTKYEDIINLSGLF
jgi:hypothetical protein